MFFFVICMDQTFKHQVLVTAGHISVSPVLQQVNALNLVIPEFLFSYPLQPFPDRTPQRLEFTLKVAEGTLNRSAEVLQTITPISSKVEEWAENMRNNEYSTDAYEQAIVSAGEAGIITAANVQGNIIHIFKILSGK